MTYHRQSVPSPGSSLWETLPWYEYNNGRVSVTSGDPNTVFISNVALFTRGIFFWCFLRHDQSSGL